MRAKEAEKQIQKWLVASPNKKMTTIAGKLPASLKKIAMAMLDRDANGKKFTYRDREKSVQFIAEQATALGKLSVTNRSKLIAAFSPNLKREIEIGFQSIPEQNDFADYEQSFFRYPKHAGNIQTRQMKWLGKILLGMAQLSHEVHDIELMAAWASYFETMWQLAFDADDLAVLFAAVIDRDKKNGDKIYDVMAQSINGEHEIGSIGSIPLCSMMRSNRKSGWQLVCKTLLAAQRQEGLRQVILEALPAAKPEAAGLILQTVIDNKLARFSSVVRAVDQWFGLEFESLAVGKINAILESFCESISDKKKRQKCLDSGVPDEIYFALVAESAFDAEVAAKQAIKLTKHDDCEVRYVACRFLKQMDTDVASRTLGLLLDDPDIRVRAEAFEGIQYDDQSELNNVDRFDSICRFLDSFKTARMKVPAIVWPWTEKTLQRSDVADTLPRNIGKRKATVLIPYLKSFDSWSRSDVIERIAKQKNWDEPTRQCMLAAIGDSVESVREAALKGWGKRQMTEDEEIFVESLLNRKTAAVRTLLIERTLKKKDSDCLASATRLIGSGKVNQRVAGLEVLRQLADGDRSRKQAIELTKQWLADRKKTSKDERTQVDAIIESGVEKPVPENGFGLMDPEQLTAPVVPTVPKAFQKKQAIVSKATIQMVYSLDKLVEANRKLEIEYYDEMQPLSKAGWAFPDCDVHEPIKDQLKKLPFKEIWIEWDQSRPKTTRDKDGLELLRGFLVSNLDEWGSKMAQSWFKGIKERQPIFESFYGKSGIPKTKLKHPNVVSKLITWLFHRSARKNVYDCALDSLEYLFQSVPESEMKLLIPKKGDTGYYWDVPRKKTPWRSCEQIRMLLCSTQQVIENKLYGAVTKKQMSRLWNLVYWHSRPFPEAKPERPDGNLVLFAMENKLINRHDLVDSLVGPHQEEFSLMRRLSSSRPGPTTRAMLEKSPLVGDTVTEIANQIYELELKRGDMQTESSKVVESIGAVYGVDKLISLMEALGKDGFKATAHWYYGEINRRVSLTMLSKVCFPAEGETLAVVAKKFKAAVKTDTVSEDRILQLAFLAPQWASHVQEYFKWDGMLEALYWFMAHMSYVGGADQAAIAAGFEDDESGDDDFDEYKDDDEEVVKPRQLSPWERLILERTPLTLEQRQEGVIDVAWFAKVYKHLSAAKWERMAAAARYSATPQAAKKAKLIADVLAGKTKRSTIVEGIKKRNLKDNVRLLGLLPLPNGARAEKEILERYKVLSEYQRYAKGLSSLSRPDALRAYEIGMENLARTAGYQDPLRMQWSLEAEATKDIVDGSIVLQKDDVTVSMEIDEWLKPHMSYYRGDRQLKSLPKSHKKHKAFVDLADRSKELRKQGTRVRGSLETAMLRGDSFTGVELTELADHALVYPALSRLVLIGEGIMGYPIKKGKGLIDFNGKIEPVKKRESLTIAHPYDLLKSRKWSQWQKECFVHERIQPFKQVFRELYVPTAQEKKDKTVSRRYGGHQVQPRQSMALWGARNWHTNDGVWKMFHDEGIIASVEFDYGYTTPLEVEGWTIDSISFRRRDEYKPLPLTKVPPKIFSEVMRDCDLVVSVAHSGGVDPEASASTVEMRASLLSETMKFLKIKNVKIEKDRVKIKGSIADYSIHLGSGVVHKQPGGSVCLVPVHSQHRGRLFLPFADDDPRTAEVISKTLLLAKDDEIKDPILLQQIRI